MPVEFRLLLNSFLISIKTQPVAIKQMTTSITPALMEVTGGLFITSIQSIYRLPWPGRRCRAGGDNRMHHSILETNAIPQAGLLFHSST